jgi:tRNA-Thr(GGU) m(6)t(6)A37 methyltransferase TsaA
MNDTAESAGWTVHQVATVASTRIDPIDDDWGEVEAILTLCAPYGADALRGLTEFTHVEVIYLFDRVDPETVTLGARVPRGNPAWPEVGIFAQRAKNRPNRLGLATCTLLAVDGSSIRVRGLDAIDGTPVLDIKPLMAEFGPRGPVHQPAWSHELMRDYY